MKRQMLKGYPWPEEKHSIAIRKAVIDDGMYLIVDFVSDKPQLRVCIGKKEYANYYPEGTAVTVLGKKDEAHAVLPDSWDQKQIAKVIESDLLVKQSVSYDDGGTGVEKENLCGWIGLKEHDCQKKLTERKHEIRRDRIQEFQALVPEIPSGFFRWARKQCEEHLFTYEPFRRRKQTTGICSNCGQESVVENIQQNQTYICPKCNAKTRTRRMDYKHKNPRPVQYKEREVILFQRVEGGYVERHFISWMKLAVAKEKYGCEESARIFLRHGKERTFYAKYSYLTREVFWDDANFGYFDPGGMIRIENGPIYPYTFRKSLTKGTKYQYSALEQLRKEPGFSPIEYLQRYEKYPVLEQMVKAGLRKLALQMDLAKLNLKAKKTWELFGLTKDAFHRLRQINGGKEEILWFQYMEQQHLTLPNAVICGMAKEGIEPANISGVPLSPTVIYNYLKRQATGCKGRRRMRELLGTWEDYLSMASYLKMPMDQDMVLRPRDLLLAHREVLSQCGGKEKVLRVVEIANKFPRVEAVLASIKEKYEYVGKTFSIVVPEKIEQIIEEGQALKHCLDRSDRYFERIANQESYIVFLRRTKAMEQPYYTLEIEPDGTTRQKRTVGDNQNNDYHRAEKFLKKWQAAIRPRLSQEDFERQEISRQLRMYELESLRNDKVTVHGGIHAGELLADILEADLMEA